MAVPQRLWITKKYCIVPSSHTNCSCWLVPTMLQQQCPLKVHAICNRGAQVAPG